MSRLQCLGTSLKGAENQVTSTKNMIFFVMINWSSDPIISDFLINIFNNSHFVFVKGEKLFTLQAVVYYRIL